VWLTGTRCNPTAPALLLLLVAAVATTRVAAVPPIAYEGRFVTTARSTIPEDGDSSVQLGSSTRLDLRSYIWEPWFATVAAGVNLSQVNTYGPQDSSALLAGADTRLQVFPRSRFPFAAFASVSDSRSEFDSIFVEDREVRRTRFGAVQQYRPLAGNASYSARVERSIETGAADDLDEVTDLVDLNATYGLTDHNFEGTVNFQRTRREAPDEQFRDLVGTLRHSWRPSPSLSMENFFTVTDTTTDAAGLDLRTTTTNLSSFSVWRPAEHPLTVTGNARINGVSTSASGRSNSSYSGNGSVSASYDVTRALRVSATASATVTSSDVNSSQSATVSYSPSSFRLLDSDYTWFTSASVNNSTGESASRGVSAVIGHGINKALPLDSDGVYNLSGSLSQSLSSRFDTIAGGLFTFNHGAFVALGRSTTAATTRARLSLQDSHTQAFGGDETNTDSFVQSASLQVNHDWRLSRFDSLGASMVLSLTRQGLDDDASTFPSSSLGLNYRHTRLFGVNRLRFLSTLSLTSDSLSFVSAGDDGRRDISWNNRLDYSIGRVEARLTGAVTDANGRLNTVIFFTLTRRIGGVF
jgi:hypothetical protein